MPKLSEFASFAVEFEIQVKAAGAKSVSSAVDIGKATMCEFIMADSPTGSEGHNDKNSVNGYPEGSRLGNASYGEWPTQPNPGNMYRSVQKQDAVIKGEGIMGKFGWIDNQDEYFKKQDAGTYGVGKRRGMGLINFPGPRSKGTEHKLIAAIAAEENLRTVAKQNGFTISGGGSWK
jgi:hypothetical protein